MNKSNPILIISCFILAIGSGLFASETDPFNKRFSYRGAQYVISVEPSMGIEGNDIFLTNEKTRKNLSLDFDGENLFPNVRIRGNHFYITWILSRDQQVYGCYYNSFTGTSHMIPCEGFHFLSSPYLVFQGPHPRPLAMVFLGRRPGIDNDKNNDEVFAYHLETGRLFNLTKTPENEKVFSVIEENRGFSLRTETIPFSAVYTIGYPGLDVVKVEKHQKEIEAVSIPTAVTADAYNTIVAFGDSITWGKIRMNDLVGEHHPDLAYLGLIQSILVENYGTVDTVNLGIPADNTFKAINRLHDDFSGVEAFFCLIMLGTVDVGQNLFSAASTEENLYWICLQIRDNYGMYPVISTIPPMRDKSGSEFLKTHIEDLNDRIKNMAEEINIPCVDTYAAFFEQPDWEEMLEDIVGNHKVAAHPSPAGHRVIADLFLPKILELPPQTPSNILFSAVSPIRMNVEWRGNYEFDFSHYVIEFAFNPGNLNRRTVTIDSFFSFIRLPFHSFSQSRVYFRIRAKDKADYSSDFSEVVTAEF